MMKRFLLLAALLPLAPAAEPEWFAPGTAQARALIGMWEHEAQGVAQEFARYRLSQPDTATAESALPAAEPDETAVECDGALLFDTESSNFVFTGNVRLSDPRLQLRAHSRLFIRMEQGSVDKNKQDAQEEALQPHSSAEEAPETAPKEETQAALALPRGLNRPMVEADDAVVDTEHNLIILSSSSEHARISAANAEAQLEVCGSAQQPARMLLDSEGNIFICGGEITLTLPDPEHSSSRVMHVDGTLYFSAAQDTAVLSGKGSYSSPEGAISFDRLLTLRLHLARPETPREGFMQQLAGLRYEGLAAAHAEGAVVADWRGSLPQPAHLDGDTLDYNADTGLCTVEGDACSVVYGADSLRGAQHIELQPDGKLVLRGRDLSGDYERPAMQGQAAQRGHFTTAGDITYTDAGDHGVILLPQGISMADAGGDFRCAGPVELHLRPAEQELKVPALPDSKLNLALARYAQIAYAKAEGGISAHLYAADGSVQGELRAQRAELDFVRGALCLLGSAEVPALATYDGNRLEATAGADTQPQLLMQPNGDIELRGGDINAAFRTKEGEATAHCRGGLRLVRESCRLETDSAAEFRSAQGVLTTKGPLSATLSVREGASAPLTALLPNLTFPYNGIIEMATEQGGSVQTTKGSLQCDGLIRVTMAPAPDAEYGGLQSAEAHGHVAVAGKDKDGRLLRATGDDLRADMTTGEKLLTGSTVTLSDAYNTHSASGAGAAVRIDAQNSARISGAVQKTSIRRISEQIEQQKKKQKP